jgi:ABC-type multidrug transport system fused ATPase/permease subunit
VSDVSMRYRADFDPVLKGLTVTINQGDRIGIVGRTGSGKSSIFRAVLRLTEIESGKIFIDGVDISAVGLDAIRSGISIIPQDPVLFSGTIRANLDPFSKLSDTDLWSALKKANLHQTISGLPGGLLYQVSEGGENFSAGQRQLLCMARALLRRCKILLLDEATSSVDYETDALIQKTIKQEFKSCTILTVAHRMSNVLDSDKIIVMDGGRIVEYDTPRNQLQNPSSVLFRADRKNPNNSTVVGIFEEDRLAEEASKAKAAAAAEITANNNSTSLAAM